MTVGTTARIIEYAGDDSATPRAVPFYFLGNDDLRVTRVNADASEDVLVRGTDYSVAGAGDPSGGNVTPLAAIASGTMWRIEGALPLTQPTDYTAGDDFPAETNERALDRIMIGTQESRRDLDDTTSRAPRVARGKVAPPIADLDGADGKVLALANGQIVPIDNDPAFAEDAAARADESAGLAAVDRAAVAADRATVAADKIATADYKDQAQLADASAEASAADAANSASLAQQWLDADWYATWVALSGVAGTAGDKAIVPEDAGTHTDPVTSATVDNSGLYLFTTGWQWIASTEAMKAKEYADQTAAALANVSAPTQLKRISSDLTLGAFPDVADLLGPYMANDLFNPPASGATLSWAGGVVTLEPSGASTVPHLFTRGEYWSGNEAVDVEFSYEVDAADVVAGQFGPRLGFGTSSANLRLIAYRSTSTTGGTIQVHNASETVLASSPDYTTDAAMTFDRGDVVKLKVHLEPGGAGYALATNSDGTQLRFAISGIPAGWIWYGTGDARETHYSNPQVVFGRTIDRAKLSGLSIEDFDGWYAASSDGFSSSFEFQVDSDGVGQTNVGSATFYYAKTGLEVGDVPMEFWCEASRTSGSGGTGAILIFGDSTATRRCAAYLTTGTFAVFTGGGSVSTWNGNLNNALVATNGERVRLHAVVMPNGVGYFTAIHPSGRMETIKATDIPAGMAALGWRGSAVGEIAAFGGRPATAATIMAAIERAERGHSRYPKRWRVLPSFPADRRLVDVGDPDYDPGEFSTDNGDYPGMIVPGITPTGAAVPVSGQFRNCYVVGDDGRLTEANPGTQQCYIHIFDEDCGLILRTITPAVSGSVQGIAPGDVAGSLTDDPDIWAAFPQDDSIRKFDLATMTEVGADAITGITALTGAGSNALAFDATQGASGGLWTCDSTATNPTVASLIDVATGAVADTINIPAQLIDHFQLVGRKLLFQYGGNGTRANIGVYDLDTDVATATLFGPLELVFAPEGFFYNAATGMLRIFQDPGYHNSIGSGPRFNSFVDFYVGPL